MVVVQIWWRWYCCTCWWIWWVDVADKVADDDVSGGGLTGGDNVGYDDNVGGVGYGAFTGVVMLEVMLDV